MTAPLPASSAQRDRYASIAVGACFAAGWAMIGVILGIVGGWWALLVGPVIPAVTLLGLLRYAERQP